MNEKESWKRLEQVEEEIVQITPELNALKDNLVRYEIAAAEERQTRDLLIATWRDVLHAALKQIGTIDPKMVHAVIDNMDDFLNRAGGRRK